MSNKLRIFQDQSSFPLDNISVASPCHAEWEDMVGSDKVRFCASCQKNVFNLSGMRRDEAVDLLRATEGRACIRFFRRADGTVLTEDCPVGVALLVKKAKRMTYAAAAVSIGAVATMLAFLGGSFTKSACERLDTVKTSIETVIDTVPQQPEIPMMGAPPPMPEMLGEAVMVEPPPKPVVKMGKVAMPRQEFKGDAVMPHVEVE